MDNELASGWEQTKTSLFYLIKNNDWIFFKSDREQWRSALLLIFIFLAKIVKVTKNQELWHLNYCRRKCDRNPTWCWFQYILAVKFHLQHNKLNCFVLITVTLYIPAMSNPNGLLGQKSCRYFNQGRTFDDILMWTAH